MSVYRLKQGYDLKIAGRADELLEEKPVPQKAALMPSEFKGLKPRLTVKPGDLVKRGSVLFIDKGNEDLKVVSPISGKVTEINRGERRRILSIVVESDGKNEQQAVGNWSVDEALQMKREQVTASLLAGGMWPFIISRPYGGIARPQHSPRDIFISAMDTAPLAANPNFLLQGEQEDFQLGIQMLQKLTDGKVYLSLDGNGGKVAPAFEQATGVEKNTFSGKHPAGNVGVQIHHIKPLARGQHVWQVQPYAVALIGKFFKSGVFPSERIVATAGSALRERKYYKTIAGAPLATLINEQNLPEYEVRFISGNVLTGTTSSIFGYVSFYEPLITVIAEGKKERKLLGYFRPGLKSLSVSRTFLSRWLPAKKEGYTVDTLANGAPRAFVMSASDYQKVLPMDIMPVQLMKSIMVQDIVEMEGLGIMELLEEDVALCSYMDLSKTDFGAILRQGLDLMEKEL